MTRAQGVKQIAQNRKAFHDYFVLERYEAGIELFGTEVKSTVRTVYHYEVERDGDLISLRVCANGFLYNMCRAIVGTLVYASYGKIEPEDIPKLLELGDRRLTGPTMPPQGLYLNRVGYEGPAGIMMLKD